MATSLFTVSNFQDIYLTDTNIYITTGGNVIKYNYSGTQIWSCSTGSGDARGLSGYGNYIYVVIYNNALVSKIDDNPANGSTYGTVVTSNILSNYGLTGNPIGLVGLNGYLFVSFDSAKKIYKLNLSNSSYTTWFSTNYGSTYDKISYGSDGLIYLAILDGKSVSISGTDNNNGTQSVYYSGYGGSYNQSTVVYGDYVISSNTDGTSGGAPCLFVMNKSDGSRVINFTSWPYNITTLSPKIYGMAVKDNYLYAYNSSNSKLSKFQLSSSVAVVCFLEGTKILYLNNQNKEEYIPIEKLRKGMLVKTLTQGFVPINMIGRSAIMNNTTDERIKDRLYCLSKEKYPELTEDLIITGCHSILVDSLNAEQCEKTVKDLGNIYSTEDKYRLMAYLDEKAIPYKEKGVMAIYHLALDNNDYYKNYGIYANGLLAETCSQRYLKELSGMELLGEEPAKE